MEVVHCKVSRDITICGFIDLVDVASPPAISRHLVLPVPSANKAETSLVDLKADGEAEDDVLTPPEEGKSPSFCVLLHGALKVLLYNNIVFENWRFLATFPRRLKIWEPFVKWETTGMDFSTRGQIARRNQT